MRHWALLVVVAAGLVPLGAACSSGDDDASSDEATAETSGAVEEGGDGGGTADAEGVSLGLPAGDPIQAGRSIIASADVSLEVDDAREASAQAVEDPEDDPLPGFLGGLRNGWDGFVTTASVLVTGLGYALPFLVLAAVAGAAWLGLRRRRAEAAA